MPTINVNDAYVLNETGAQVDKVTGLYFKNENASDTEKAQARANIGAGGSNPNLLDNAYFVGGGSQLGDGIFPINQRGQTSYSGTGNTIDRWKCNDPVGVLSLSASGMSITVGTQFCGYQQYLPMGTLVEGETYTLSIKINGTVYSWIIPSLSTSGQSQYAGWFGNSNIYSYIGVLNGKWRIMPFDSATGTLTTVSGVQAMKLEKGTVSTLANDPPPDFGEELRKCQRYLRQIPLKRFLVYLDAAYSVALATLTGVEMASQPNISIISAMSVYSTGSGTLANVTSASIIDFTFNIPTIQLALSTALSGFGVVFDGQIRLSCEL